MTTRAAINSLCVILTVLLFSCSRPQSYETFVKAADAPGGVYSYQLDLSDSLASYDISFYSRVDRNSLNVRNEYPQIRLEVTWVSPSGQNFSETVYMRGSNSAGDIQKYRSGVVPRESGEWTLKVKAFPGEGKFRGLGVICRRNGTR